MSKPCHIYHSFSIFRNVKLPTSQSVESQRGEERDTHTHTAQNSSVSLKSGMVRAATTFLSVPLGELVLVQQVLTTK